jgi:hypothetical protein
MKTFFKNLYISMVQMLATFLMNRTNTVLRYLIILKGKNPDYLPPPPPPAPLPEPIRTEQKTLKSPPSSYGNGMAKFVLESRKKFEENQASLKAKMALPEDSNPTPTLSPTIEPELEVTNMPTLVADPNDHETKAEVAGAGAIEVLRDAVFKIEEDLGLSDKKPEEGTK